jgi:exopolysaccharide production protein ExoZ
LVFYRPLPERPAAGRQKPAERLAEALLGIALWTWRDPPGHSSQAGAHAKALRFGASRNHGIASAPESKNNMNQDKLSGIQIARAIAALSIVYFHSWVALVRFPKDTAFPLPVLTGHGWLAVDLFFAISGFVICLVASKPSFNVASFLIKRVFRLYPLWLATLTAFAVLAMIWRGLTERETLGFFLYSATLLPTEYFPFYDIGWSLQHEMVFYLIAALVIPSFGLFGLVAFLATSTLASHLIEMPWYFSNLAFYHAEFLAGVLAFMLRPKLVHFGFWLPFTVGFVALCFFFAVWGGRVYAPIALFFLILGFSNIRNARWLKPFEELGNASYSIYLIHPIVILVASAIVSKFPQAPLWSQEPIRFACFVVIVAASLFSWNYFEKPAIALGNRLADAGQACFKQRLTSDGAAVG